MRRYLRPAYAVALSVVRNVADGLPGPRTGLGLTPDQAAKTRAVVGRHRAGFQAAVEESFLRVRDEQGWADAEFRALLTRSRRPASTRRPPLRAPGFDGPPPPEGRGRGVHPRVRRPRTRV